MFAFLKLLTNKLNQHTFYFQADLLQQQYVLWEVIQALVKFRPLAFWNRMANLAHYVKGCMGFIEKQGFNIFLTHFVHG